MDPDPVNECAQQVSGGSGGLSRRTFLRRGTFTAASVAVVGSVPGLSGLLSTTAADAPAADSGVADVEGGSGALTAPLVAQLKDAGTGEISLFQGEREVVVRSPSLAQSLLAAAKR